jgi:hypothetical protein
VSNLEAALRRALAKGDVSDPAFRKRVYTAAANAMERSVNASPTAGPDDLVERRKALAGAITRLEAEITGEVPQVDETPQPDPVARTGAIDQSAIDAPMPSPDFAAEPAGTGHAPFPSVAGKRASPDRSSSASNAMRAEPIMADAPSSRSARAQTPPHHLSVEPRERPEQARNRRAGPKRVRPRPFAIMLAVTVALAGILAFIVWTWSTGAFQSAEQRDTSVPNPTPRLEAEDSPGGGGRAPALAAEGTPEEQAAAEGWITIFTPSDPTSLGLARGAEASIKSDPFGDYARLVTPSPTAEIQIDVPVGTLIDLQGRPVQINVVARADDGNPTEMSVTCDFGPLGDCGRRRFIVNQAPSEYLFRVDLPEASGLNRDGVIKLRADINDNERPLNLLAVRIREVAGN